MSIETTVDVETLGVRLGEAITETEEYASFQETKRAVENSAAAQAKIQEFERLREDYLVAREAGQADQEDLQALQMAQQELHALPEMSAYLEAQAALTGVLARVDDAISEPLEVDFAEEAGGCCHD